MTRPNVLLLTIDTLRADVLGCYGSSCHLTPNLDRLAASSIRFDQAITGGSWTQAAFPVLLTSTHVSMYGGCLGPLSPERPSPVEQLSTYGYTTAGFSTSPLLSRAYGYHRGFQYFAELLPDGRHPWLRQVKGGQRLLQSPLFHFLSKMVGKRARPAREYQSASEVNQVVGGWLEAVEAPFFCWVHYMDAHWPYHLEDTLVNPTEIAQAWRDLSHFYGVNKHGYPISDSQRTHYVNLYEEAVKYTDAQVGKLLKLLENLGLDDNTIIVVVADHGEEFLERGHWGHVENNLHDEIIRVPMIIRLPDGRESQVVNQQVRTLDIMPTILELCGCPPLDRMQGENLVPLWSPDSPQCEARVAISERWRDRGDVSHMISIRTPEFKLIWNNREPNYPKLYHLQADPGEKNDVSDYYPEIVRELKVHVEQQLERAAQSSESAPIAKVSLDRIVLERLRNLGYLE